MRILIVEDDHKIAQAIAKGFEQENFAVDVVFDGAEGFGQAATVDYDVIILDRMLPGIEGIDICKRLREKNNHTPILMLTAKDGINDRVEGLNAGADDYLIKPFAFEELLARVRALLRRPEGQITNTISVEDLNLDTHSFEVTRSGQTIELSSTEFRLLEYLMRNPNRTLTKDSIINHVWDYDADILPNTVEVFIGYLRNKIDKAFPEKEQLIHTIRGFGYSIGNKKTS
jgi:DNA-binding response OmpR family regulator